MSIQMMEKIDTFLKNYQDSQRSTTINDILEMHHICQYIDHGFIYSGWNADEVKNYKDRIKTFKKQISLYFKALTSAQIIDFYDVIEFDYSESFWLLVNRTQIYENFSLDDLDAIFSKEQFDIDEVLYCSRVVQFFDQKIRTYLLSNLNSAEMLLDYYEAEHLREQKEKFFPKSLSLSDKELLMSSYLDFEDANLNYVRLIERNKDSEFLRISDKIRLKAKRLSKRLNDEALNDAYSISIRKGTTLSDDQQEMVRKYCKEGVLIMSYSTKRLGEKTDRATLFQNFRSVFEFVDFQGSITSVSKSARIDTLELVSMRSKNEYLTSWDFADKTLVCGLKFETYRFFLESISVKVEDLLEYYVNDYLNARFGINGLRIYLPSSSGTYLEKIRLLVPEFESLIEQYRLYVLDGEIDFELLQITTKTSGFDKIPSLVKNKYVYPAGKEFQRLSYNFFSATSFLLDYKKYGKKYRSFFHLLLSEKITLENIKEIRRDFVQKFIDENHIKINENGYLKPVNVIMLTIIELLRENDVLSYWYFPQDIRNEIDNMEKNNMVTISGTLFTKSERDFYNFYMNNRFSNGLWLRNKYVHATNSHDEEEQKQDYYTLLNLLVLLVLKIEDDLILTILKNKYSIQRNF